MWIAIGLLLGVLSRVEERVDGFPAAISTWCAVAFLARATGASRADETAANAGYHAYADVTGAGAAYLP